ncbi:putative bifunctional diguanylate cyclase/phosphodiesterase [Nitrosomonas sp.]|uniref:putative bifunctional diguanylate cyclase/phosphodiesterase n=1 Tax=Nitrosomonas sp. TaxID=42353 RepID=UPI0035B02465
MPGKELKIKKAMSCVAGDTDSSRNFIQQCNKLLAQRAQRMSIAVMFRIQLKRWKAVIEIYGPDIAGQLSRKLSDRLSAYVNEHCLLAKIAEDQFAIFKTDCANDENAGLFARTLAKTVIAPINTGYLQFRIAMDVEISIYPDDMEMISEPIANAPAALLQNRTVWSGDCYYVSKETAEAAAKQRSLRKSLQTAIQKQELVLLYQPVVDLQSGDLTGVEALVRWNHPELGMLLPEDFIPLAQENGFVMELGRWVLRQACDQLQVWHSAGYPSLSVSVNVSAVEFDQAQWINTISQVLAETGMPPEFLELDIAESTLMRHAETSLQAVRSLKNLGVKIVMDNFGRGYSSPRYIKHFSVDILKIDRTLTHDMIADPDGLTIVSSMIGLAKSLGLAVQAVGVETKEQFDCLLHTGCHRAQGYLFSKPVFAQDVMQLLAQRKTGTLA